MVYVIGLILGLFCCPAFATTGDQSSGELSLVGTVQEIPEEIAQKMTGRSWKPDCPVSVSDLRLLKIPYVSFKDESRIGEMVVHKSVAQELVEIFAELYVARFPIERMELVEAYDADDDKSMEANNSSAFCFRANTTKPGIVSHHGYGIAIDINPKINPYVKPLADGSLRVLPESGRAYLDRTQERKGIITSALDNACYKAFKKRGWTWGGDWDPKTRLDYQHFSKLPSGRETKEDILNALER